MIRRYRPRSRMERGGVLVEMAIITPFLVAMVFGIAEYSMAWRADNHTVKTIRNGAVELQRNPADRLADYRVIDQMRDAIGTGGLDSVSWIIVYRTTTTAPAPPASCTTVAASLTSGSSGVTNICNVYSASYILGATSSSFVSETCSGEPDRFLCPTTRRTVFAPNDRIGIAVKWNHKWVTKLVPGSGTSSVDYAVGPLAANPRPT